MVDHKLRDLISILVIKKKLEKVGDKVFFCRNGMELPTAIVKDVDVVVLTQVYTKNWRKVALDLKKVGCKVVSMPSEGNPYTAKGKHIISSGNNLGYDNYLDLLFVWRKKIYDLTYKLNQIQKKKIIYSGFQRLISYTDKYKRLRNNITKKYKKNNKINIVFVSNFVGGDYHDYPDFRYRNEITKDASKKESIHRKKCIEFIKDTIEKYKADIHVIIKLHPYEKPNIWEAKFENYKKHISFSIGDYIEGVLEQADIIIGRDCHTMFEALLLNKIILNLSLKGNMYEEIQSEKNTFPIISKVEDIKKFIKDLKKNKRVNRKILHDFRFRKKKLETIDIVFKNLRNLESKNKNRLSRFYKMKQILKYMIFVSFDYFLHDFFYLKNKKKVKFGKTFFIDYRNRVEKHYHKADIDFIEKFLPN